MGIAERTLSRPLPTWLGVYFLCAVHRVDDVAAAVRAGKPKGRHMKMPDLQPGVIAAITHELWMLLHSYDRVAPCRFKEDFKPPQKNRWGYYIRPKAPADSHLRKLRQGELLYFNELFAERYKAISGGEGTKDWYSKEMWFGEEEEAASSFFGVHPSSLHHLLTGAQTPVTSLTGKRAQSSMRSASDVASMLRSSGLNASETLAQLHDDASRNIPSVTAE